MVGSVDEVALEAKLSRTEPEAGGYREKRSIHAPISGRAIKLTPPTRRYGSARDGPRRWGELQLLRGLKIRTPETGSTE